MTEFASYTTIAVSAEDAPVCRITLNRPAKRNAIGPQSIGELIHALTAFAASEELRVAVLTGAGTCFSAGGDLAQMSAASDAAIPPGTFPQLFNTMHGLGKPIVAMVNGHALAGGLGLMVACDLVVAADTATFGTTEIRLGLWPMMITAELTRNIGRKRTLELMLTGNRIDAAEAETIGLINRSVPADALETETMALAQKIAAHSPATMRLGLRAFYESQDMEFEAALTHLEGQLGQVLALEDAREGLTAFLQKRKPVWKGR